MEGVTVLHSVEALRVALDERLLVAPKPALGEVHRDIDLLIGEGTSPGGGTPA
jgi:hypothetical protein